MFEELIREMKKLETPRSFRISVPLDEKGYYDRLCPNSECGNAFKVLFDDWRDKVRDDVVFCPFCRHEAPSDQWHTPEQEEHIKSAGLAEMSRLVNEAMARGVARTRPTHFGGGLFKLSMSLSFRPGSIPPVVVAQASDVLRQEFACEACSCRYASLGASFFCPACGHNSAASSFQTTLDTVRKAVAALDQMKRAIGEAVDEDTATNATRQIMEDQFPRLVGAFERFSEAMFDHLPNASQFTKGSSRNNSYGSRGWIV